MKLSCRSKSLAGRGLREAKAANLLQVGAFVEGTEARIEVLIHPCQHYTMTLPSPCYSALLQVNFAVTLNDDNKPQALGPHLGLFD